MNRVYVKHKEREMRTLLKQRFGEATLVMRQERNNSLLISKRKASARGTTSSSIIARIQNGVYRRKL